MKDSGTKRVDEEDIIIIVKKKGDRDQSAEIFVVTSGMHQGEKERKLTLS